LVPSSSFPYGLRTPTGFRRWLGWFLFSFLFGKKLLEGEAGGLLLGLFFGGTF
jgi:hypothetical protein